MTTAHYPQLKWNPSSELEAVLHFRGLAEISKAPPELLRAAVFASEIDAGSCDFLSNTADSPSRMDCGTDSKDLLDRRVELLVRSTAR
jgi:hypothetical protein